MAMITSDPDTVISFMQQLTTDSMYAIGDKMKSSTLSSSYKVYNDKEMASEYSDYTDLIKKWEEKNCRTKRIIITISFPRWKQHYPS